jgi:hypothetical protein
MTRQAHLVGSVGLEDAATVFTTVSDILGEYCLRIPDGETGDRGYWIRWQQKTFDDCKDLIQEIVNLNIPGFKDSVARPFYRIRAGVDPAGIDLGELGYAKEAAKSYRLFSQLVDAGTIPRGVRFQVSIPTPMALLCGFVLPDDRLPLEAAVKAALERELEKLQALVSPDSLAVQWDVCYEVIGCDGGPPIPYDDPVTGTASRVAALCGLVEEKAECGIHLCYGDPGHRHIVEPSSLATSVAFANAICAASPRRVEFVHMPVPRNRADDDYFRPLEALELPEGTQQILGLVHHTDGVEGSRNRMAIADRYVDGYSIATECGFGRRDPGTIHELLRIHRSLCERA